MINGNTGPINNSWYLANNVVPPLKLLTMTSLATKESKVISLKLNGFEKTPSGSED